MISTELARQVLTVGPQYKDHRGGIGGVIATYQRYVRPFRFVPTYRPFRWKGWYIPYFAWKYAVLVTTLLTNRSLRVVHIHGAAEGSFYRKYIVYLTAKKLFRRKVIYHIHSSHYVHFYQTRRPWLQRRMRNFIEGTDVLVCLSESWRVQFADLFPRANVRVLGNVVEPVPAAGQRTNAERSGPMRLLFLGLLSERKGIFDLLEVLARHRTELRGRLTLTVGGNGAVERLHHYVRQHDLADLVQFAGWVTGEQKDQLLRAADVYVLPSHNEGLPLSVLEAMSYHLPILSTAVGGTPEIVTEGVNGFLVQPGDQDALADRIRQLLADPARRRAMGAASAERVRAFYPEPIFAELADVYRSLLMPGNEPSATTRNVVNAMPTS